MSADDYTSASQTVCAAPEDVQPMIESALKVHDETKLQHLIDDTVNKNIFHLFKDAHEKALADTFTEL